MYGDLTAHWIAEVLAKAGVIEIRLERPACVRLTPEYGLPD
jgi:hypothetical protein